MAHREKGKQRLEETTAYYFSWLWRT